MSEEDIGVKAAEETELILPVRSIEQSEKWDCGPTALRIALRYQFGLKLTAQDIIFLTGATGEGADEYNLIRALDMMGFRYSESSFGTLNRLKKQLQLGHPSIIHVVVSDGVGHYAVFTGYDSDNVYLADPASGKTIKYGIPYFLGVWKLEEGETNTRWYLSISGHIGDRFDSALRRLKRITKKVRDSRK